jgi:hypothetical protein
VQGEKVDLALARPLSAKRIPLKESFEFSYSKNRAFPYSDCTLEYNNTRTTNDNNAAYHFAAAVVLQAP